MIEILTLAIFYWTKKLYKEIYENTLIYNVSYKTSTCAKLLHIRFDKIDVLIKIHEKIRYLVLFDYSYCDKICDKTKYLISQKVILQIVSIIVLQESELTHIVLYLYKNIDFS